jgi:Fe-S-cluster containining protein
MNLPFYVEGLRFSCTQCSSCCRHESGYVFLAEKDVKLLAAECQMDYIGFVETYCRWIPAEAGMERLSLKEKSNFDCIFWKGGCAVYDARPLQCRAFPFWPSILASAGAWKIAAGACPGMGQGAFHSGAEIEALLAAQEMSPVLKRRGREAVRP